MQYVRECERQSSSCNMQEQCDTCVLGNSVSPTTAWSSGERLQSLFKPPAPPLPPVLFFFSFGELPKGMTKIEKGDYCWWISTNKIEKETKENSIE